MAGPSLQKQLALSFPLPEPEAQCSHPVWPEHLWGSAVSLLCITRDGLEQCLLNMHVHPDR